MGSTTAAGTTLAISATAPATFDATGFGALAATVIGGIDKLGTLGAVFAKVEFQPLNGTKDKHKGSSDNGALQPTMAIDGEDAGQILLRTAAADKTSKLYYFVATYPTGAKRGFGARVFGAPETVDGADTIITAAATIEVCTEVVKIDAP
ncbi:hypothetical protein CA223_06830 [Sphingomonas koreensis]|uniref:Phage tail protein n=1 Tax=Sphingomonas koreensis TaxID=93064 RepID=A0A1L6J7V4_9SPHN|nr:hypothetical protein [Sphingomonas koreensis]APR51989.1 hypothetical protein BRX40_05650 [Sphingomonas koreensis]RSU22791.1 hypothetical protein CA224_05270 [Sphingomonas koreensis]RSU30735.1 hypothetical protein CA222_01275 [Sphingomonas koreensis]RSU31830.1 hypothetical protein CA225_00355 [Sphingomonas koreensis]RSU39249.1 hypothetical protein BRX39_01175 [Sphingomonas koreensis]